MRLDIRPAASPAVGSFTATPGVQAVGLKWSFPTDATYAGAEVWRSNTNSLAGATQIASVTTNTFTDTGAGVGTTSDKYYWVRTINVYGRTDGAWAEIGRAHV